MENQEEKLKREILQEAENKAERIISRAQRECEQTLAKATQKNALQREAMLADAKLDAAKQCRKMTLDLEYDCQRSWLVKREACIEELLSKSLKRAESLNGVQRKKSYESLVLEAVANLKHDEIQVMVNPEDCEFVTEQWLTSLCPDVKFSVVAVPGQRAGLVFSAGNGSAVFDNTYATRLRLMREDFRERVATLL